jgi:hypothetical protein
MNYSSVEIRKRHIKLATNDTGGNAVWCKLSLVSLKALRSDGKKLFLSYCSKSVLKDLVVSIFLEV